MDIVVRRCRHVAAERRCASAYLILLDGNDAIAGQREDRAGHHLDRIIARLEAQGRLPRALSRLNGELSLTPLQGLARDGYAVHGDAVERRVVALGVQFLAQRCTDTLAQRQ